MGRFLAALGLLLASQSLIAQTQDQPSGGGKQVIVEPSKEIRYPQESDILNKTQLKTQPGQSAPGFSNGYAPSNGKLLNGWYLQVLSEESESTVQAQAEKLRVALPGQEVYIQQMEKGWRILTGPLGPTLIEKSLKAATALGLKNPTLKRE